MEIHLPSCFILIFYLFTFLFRVQTTIDRTSFTLPDMQDTKDIRFEGDAYAASGVIELTLSNDTITDQSVGRATYVKPMHLWDNTSGNLVVADFSTHFSMAINSEGCKYIKGYGLTFFLSSNESVLLPESGGGKLGLVSYNTNENPNFVAVEFDTFQDDVDPKHIDDHIGIDLNRLSSEKYLEWPRNDIPIGGRVNVSIYYEASSKNLSVSVRNGHSETNTSIEYSLSCPVDLQQYLPAWVRFGFSAATSLTIFETNQIYSWDFSSTLSLPESVAHPPSPQVTTPTSVTPSTEVGMPISGKRESKTWLWGLLGIGGLVLVLGLVWFGFWMKRTKQREGRRKGTGEDFEMEIVPRSSSETFQREIGPRRFSYKELEVATNNFAHDQLLGKGGFGIVYMGLLSDGNSRVAVKRITSDSQQGLKEYTTEVKTISRLRHRNLVQLIGCCHKAQELLIVYEYMPNKSLDVHLFNKKYLLTWEKRYGIALGLASALLYLQEECERCVLHRDIKSSNVLLDSNFNAKLGDFGLARLVEHGQRTDTTKLIGTDGYVAPEYLQSRKATKESDVYSFGIVALEIASGRPAFKEVDDGNVMTNRMKLVDWVWEQYRSGNIFAAVDPQLIQNYYKEEMERLIVVGLACAHPNYADRPSIREANEILLKNKAPSDVLSSKFASYQAYMNTFSGSPPFACNTGTSVNSQSSATASTSN
ncbi:hypothetical protein P3X46_024754 [Hevea brasiliensis]|uniref:non-specific serine/threonine protein kinase n=1 Tax=Hevea brasiliensis TaxID=3981 RepID=A0ABQ9L3H4_HEVBR|nr:L-type lectin-domain containing receptor kinase IX.1-like [Hevea brasiliensis]KAJ9159234.1 hypothetical protein P3X46_024754 [Hevea brasiliensis]